MATTNSVVNDHTNVGNLLIGRNVTVNYINPTHSIDEPIAFNIPKRIKSFKGRDEQLQILTNWLKETRMIVVKGCGGFGKTELVKEFVSKHTDQFNIVWLNSETPAELHKSITTLADYLKIQNLDSDTMYAHVFGWFSKHHVIVVFDNAQSSQQISKFKPEGDNFTCVVTSNMPDWPFNVQMMTLQPLAEAAALEVLRAELEGYFKETDVDMYRKITQLICNVPLALQVVASYIHKQLTLYSKYFSLSAYVQKLISGNDIIIQNISTTSENIYSKSFLQAITISLNTIQNTNDDNFRLAWKILHVSVYLYADCVFYSDLLSIPYINKNTHNEIQLKKACGILDSYSLITKDNEHIKIHRIIQDVLKCYQNELFASKPNKYYFACFKILLTNEAIAQSHRYSILQCSNFLPTFDYFYRNYRQEISNSAFFVHLIYTNSRNLLIEIFNKIKKRRLKIINHHCLLHHAVRCQHYDIIRMLLQFGADVDNKDEYADTPLLIAAEILDMNAIQILVSHKADVNISNQNQDTVLHRVIAATGFTKNINKYKEAEEIFQYLVDAGADIYALAANKQSLLHKAAQALQPSLVSRLVQDYNFNVNILDTARQTPLFYICDAASTDRLRRMRTAECLLALGVRKEQLDIYGDTAAELACQLGLVDLANYLNFPGKKIKIFRVHATVERMVAAAGAGDVTSLREVFAELGETAVQKAEACCVLHEAVQAEQVQALEFLLKHGVSVDSRNDKNQTPLWLAVTQLNYSAMQVLVEHGADVTAVNSLGWSVLQALVAFMRFPVNIDRYKMAFEMLQYLVAHGADVHHVGQDNETLVHWAAQSGSPELVCHLVEKYGLDVNSTDNHFQTPIYWALRLIDDNNPEERALKTVRCLITLGARWDIRDKQNCTPETYARLRKLRQLKKFLAKQNSENAVDVGMHWRKFTNFFRLRRYYYTVTNTN